MTIYNIYKYVIIVENSRSKQGPDEVAVRAPADQEKPKCSSTRLSVGRFDQKRSRFWHEKMCSLEKRGNVYVLKFVGDGDHRFNPTTLDAISHALNTVHQASDARALVTTNEGRYFSNGIDLRWIAADPSSRLDIVNKFEDMLAAFMRLGVPTVAAICGHAAAGGFMLALAHDYRFMTRGRSVLYMSELDHGMHIPTGMMGVIRSKLSPLALRDVVLGSRKLSADVAAELGILDGVCEDAAATLEAAVKEAEKLAARGWKREVYSGLRMGAFPGVVDELEVHRLNSSNSKL